MLDELKLVFFALFFFGGTFVGGCVTNRAWEKDAIIQGFGYYSDFGSPIMASFKWVTIANDTEMKAESRNLWYKEVDE